MSVFFWIVIFFISMFILVKASDYFVQAAEEVGTFLRIPHFVIGVTILAIGTSLPELFSSIAAVLHDSSEIVIGEVVGSNISNIFLVIGIAAIIGKKMQIDFELINVDLPLLVGSAIFLTIIVWDGILVLPEALFSLVFLVIYILYVTSIERDTQEYKKKGTLWKPVAILIASGLFLYLGAEYMIQSVLKLSKAFDIATEIIATSAVALGTSLPELTVSVSAARRGRFEMAVGNVLGSNIFNSLGVIGIAALFGNLAIPQSVIIFSLPVMMGATILFLFVTQDRQITKWEGWMFVMFYVLFISKLFNLF